MPTIQKGSGLFKQHSVEQLEYRENIALNICLKLILLELSYKQIDLECDAQVTLRHLSTPINLC